MNPKQAIIANVVALLSLGLGMFGINLTPDQQHILGEAGIILLATVNAIDNYIAHRKETPA